jgi:GR25 family glycosyltransferase involved in LPS biosynthesis
MVSYTIHVSKHIPFTTNASCSHNGSHATLSRMKVFVISLRKSSDRRTHMTNLLNTLGVSFEFFDAFDGLALPSDAPAYDADAWLKNNGTPMTPGELGCAMSHRAIYERMVTDNIPEALILEDDVVIDPALVPILSDKSFINSVHYDWLQIDYFRVGLPFLRAWMKGSIIQIRRKPSFIWYALAKAPVIIAMSIYEKLRELYRRIRGPAIISFYRPLYLASAYIVTLDGAKKLIQIQTPVSQPSDRAPNTTIKQGQFVMKALSPQLAHQDKNYPSHIAPYAG